VTLIVNGTPLAVVAGPEYTSWWSLQPGRYVFAASATRRDGSIVRSKEVTITVE
jgi:hypothetical protein